MHTQIGSGFKEFAKATWFAGHEPSEISEIAVDHLLFVKGLLRCQYQLFKKIAAQQTNEMKQHILLDVV